MYHTIIDSVCKGRLDTLKMAANYPEFDIHHMDDDIWKFACYHGHLHIMKYIADSYSFDVSWNNNYAMRMAIYFGYDNVVHYLIGEKHVDISNIRDELLKTIDNTGNSQYLSIIQ